jgi:hypothetical protein
LAAAGTVEITTLNNSPWMLAKSSNAIKVPLNLSKTYSFVLNNMKITSLAASSFAFCGFRFATKRLRPFVKT